MSPTPDDVPARDDDLRQLFAAERAREEPTVPAFAHVLTRVPALRRTEVRRRWLQPAIAIGVAAIVVVAVGVWRPSDRDQGSQAAFVVVPGQLRVPTDFLLDIASSTALRAGEVPSIGALDWYPLVPRANAAPTTTSRRN
ncbi:MAG: hypothetical protein Q8K82_10610 [Gemmatimonadaceae bacterium]|nr:hypothetical protein [Gemmatimonadaceae bacterium]